MTRALIVLSAVGFHWDEAAVPFAAWRRAGWDVAVATPEGRVPNADPASVKVRPFLQHLGYGTARRRAPGSGFAAEFEAALQSPLAISDIDATDWDVVYVAGGHGCLFDLHGDAALDALLMSAMAEERRLAAICHASSVLAQLRRSDGVRALHGRRLTGFPTLLEHLVLALGWVDRSFRPLPLWTGRVLDEAADRPLALRLRELLDLRTIVRDGAIITGVGPKAAGALAARLIDDLRACGGGRLEG